MEETLLYPILSVFFIVLAIKLSKQMTRRKQHRNLPPSPPSVPIIGHLHLLKQPIQRTLLNLSQKYGPIISLRFGSRQTIVVSSPSAVEECFTKNDVVLSNRPKFLLGKYVAYNNTTLATENYNDHWRNLRRISTVEIFSSNRLNKSLSIRIDEVNLLLRRLYRVSCHGFARVELRSMLFDLTSNVIMRMVAGKRYYGEDVEVEEEERDFRKMLEEFAEYTEMKHIADLFPSLQWIDCGRFIKKLVKLAERLDLFLQGLIEEHRIDKDRNSMISYLLALQESDPDSCSDETIKGLILVLLLAGSETSSSALEWAISNLLNNPTVLNKLKVELDIKIGQDRLIEESDLPKLNYLQSIIHENLRLCPVVPMLIPHLSSEDCTIGGYHVPANTMLLVNVWAIQRDPDVWEDPTSFKPERFEDGKLVERFKLLPFGMGRRACPGEGLAMRTMSLTLGSLIQCFEWERIDGKEVDMREKVVASMTKAEPLQVMCKARPISHKVL